MRTLFSTLRMTEAEVPSNFAGVHWMSVCTTNSSKAGRRLMRVAQLLMIEENKSGSLAVCENETAGRNGIEAYFVVCSVVFTYSMSLTPSASNAWMDMNG